MQSSPAAGTVQLLGDGKTARFTPAADFAGLARFTHTTDSTGDSMSGEIGVRVVADDGPPVLTAYDEFSALHIPDPARTGAPDEDADQDGLTNALSSC